MFLKISGGIAQLLSPWLRDQLARLVSRLTVQCWWKTKKININILIAKGGAWAPSAPPLAAPLIVSSPKWASKMSTLPINGKIYVKVYACVVYVYNVTSALYCAINNHFCVIKVSFVATSRLACRWMYHSPRTRCAWRLTPTYMCRKHAKTNAHIYVM